ncbi:MAG: hypothetical protein II399_03910 [Lachnospiraceae bacterium]|nr:hypothetical protein [Lachnospiraceae bacterium]
MIADIVLAVVMLIATGAIVWHVKTGIDDVLERERRCTETVSAEVTSFYKYKLFGLEFFQVNMRFDYDNKMYETSKGYFKSKEPSRFLPLHINPDLPTECFLTTVKEKCSNKKKKSVI